MQVVQLVVELVHYNRQQQMEIVAVVVVLRLVEHLVVVERVLVHFQRVVLDIMGVVVAVVDIMEVVAAQDPVQMELVVVVLHILQI